jgi:hypothetical protein
LSIENFIAHMKEFDQGEREMARAQARYKVHWTDGQMSYPPVLDALCERGMGSDMVGSTAGYDPSAVTCKKCLKKMRKLGIS